MSITASFEGVNRFLEENDELISDIRDTVSSASDEVKSLADRVKANRDATEELVKKVGDIPFAVAKKSETKTRQAKLLEEIKRARRKIHQYRDDPTMMGLFKTNLAALYQELGNTYLEDVVEKMVTFTQEEVDEIRVLIRRATLDAEARQNIADILDAAVQIGKVALKLGVKLAA